VVGKSMRYVAMQVLTWGTIAGAVGSALLLAVLEGAPLRYPVELPSVLPLLGETASAARPRAPAPASSAAFVAR
jgi:hypothetical protein